jgi:Secretion system C-terminal sorting domain
MKKIILLFTMISGAWLGNAQCVPGTKTVAGAKSYILPDSATGMKHGCAGLPYEEIFYIKAPKDTQYLGITVLIDSIVINLDPVAMGLPSYLTLASVPAALPSNSTNAFPHLKIRGDSLACLKVTGTVTAGTAAGSTPLNIGFKGFANPGFAITLPGSYTAYKLVIDPSGVGACAVAINDINKNISNITVVPNPAQQNISINTMADADEKVSITIVNAMGQTTHTKAVTLRRGDNYIPFDIAALPAGIYVYHIRNAQNQVVSGKFSKH